MISGMVQNSVLDVKCCMPAIVEIFKCAVGVIIKPIVMAFCLTNLVRQNYLFLTLKRWLTLQEQQPECLILNLVKQIGDTNMSSGVSIPLSPTGTAGRRLRPLLQPYQIANLNAPWATARLQ